jgi:enamine deaminase RidA (YjgF/YER057c/UK114 family)
MSASSKTVITSDAAPAGGPYSPGLIAGGWVFLAGQTAPGETIEDQVTAAFEKVSALLAEAGCTLDDEVSCQVHLSDLGAFQRFNAVYEKHFTEPRPVRTTVGAALLGGALAELTVVARRPPAQ